MYIGKWNLDGIEHDTNYKAYIHNTYKSIYNSIHCE